MQFEAWVSGNSVSLYRETGKGSRTFSIINLMNYEITQKQKSTKNTEFVVKITNDGGKHQKLQKMTKKIDIKEILQKNVKKFR